MIFAKLKIALIFAKVNCLTKITLKSQDTVVHGFFLMLFFARNRSFIFLANEPIHTQRLHGSVDVLQPLLETQSTFSIYFHLIEA